MYKPDWTAKVPLVMLAGLLVLAGACDHFEDLRLEINSVNGRTTLTLLDRMTKERGMVCSDESSREITDLASLPLPAVVLCKDWDRNVDFKAEVKDDSAFMEISATSGLIFGSPPAESLAKAVQQEIKAAVPEAVVKVRGNT